MKIFNILIAIFFISSISAQTVQATIKKDAGSENCVIVSAKSSGDIDAPPGNYIMTISIPDNDPTNPTPIVSNLLPGMILDGNNPMPYTLGGRRYMDLNIVQDGNPPNIVWTAGTEYEIGKICFGDGTIDHSELVQINDLASGGTNGFSYWYFEVQGLGDVTNYASKFYDDGGVTSNSTNAGDSNAETTETVALPVELYKFEVTKRGNAASVEWSTSSEINGSHFEIQRSTNIIKWDEVGRVDAVGNTNSKTDYRFLDDSFSSLTDGIYYYRLRMVDMDGTYEYTEVKSVTFSLTQNKSSYTLDLYPNPSRDYIKVGVDNINEDQQVELAIYDVEGRLVLSQVLNSSIENTVSLERLNSGSYNAVVTTGNQTMNKKFVVQK